MRTDETNAETIAAEKNERVSPEYLKALRPAVLRARARQYDNGSAITPIPYRSVKRSWIARLFGDDQIDTE